jgi:hypothetical protein
MLDIRDDNLTFFHLDIWDGIHQPFMSPVPTPDSGEKNKKNRAGI